MLNFHISIEIDNINKIWLELSFGKSSKYRHTSRLNKLIYIGIHRPPNKMILTQQRKSYI